MECGTGSGAWVPVASSVCAETGSPPLCNCLLFCVKKRRQPPIGQKYQSVTFNEGTPFDTSKNESGTIRNNQVIRVLVYYMFCWIMDQDHLYSGSKIDPSNPFNMYRKQLPCAAACCSAIRFSYKPYFCSLPLLAPAPTTTSPNPT